MVRQRVLLLVAAIFVSGAFFEAEPFTAKEKGPVFYRGREYRDPTVNPLLSKPTQEEQHKVQEFVTLPPLTIQGVFWGGDSPRAIINEQVVRKGDTLPDGIEILDISGSGIKVLYREKIFTILPQGVVKE